MDSAATTGNPADSLSIQSFNSYVGASAATDRAAIMSRIRQEYKPFDITVVELTATPQSVNGHTVSAASSFAAMGATQAINNSDPKHFDAYIVVGRFTVAGSTNLGYGGLAPGGNGNAVSADFSGMVNLAGSSIEYTADAISHEAGHVFGLKHVYQSGNAGQFGQDDIYYPGTTQNASDFAIDEIMSYNHVKPDMTPIGFFFRYPTLDGSKQNGNTYDNLSSTKDSTALQFLNDPNIGRGAYEYVSGTSQNDIITITKTNATTARVVVSAFRDKSHTLEIPVPGSNGTRTSFSYDITLDRPLLIMTGAGDDNVHVVGGNLGVSIEYDLGTGVNDTIDGITTSGDVTGASVTSAVFQGAAAGAFDKVTLTFSEAVNPTTVNNTTVTLTGPGGPITPGAVAAVAGSGGTQFNVSIPQQTAPGTYTVTTGVGILDLAGNLMNQNLNAINGEAGFAPTGDQFSGADTIVLAPDTKGANVALAFSGAAAGSIDTVTLTFSEAINPSTVNTGTVTLTGPGGPIAIGSITEILGSGGTQFIATFLPKFAAGTYTVQTGVDIRDLAGNLMDQNFNGINGELGLDPAGDEAQLSTTLVGTVDVTGASITSASFSGAVADTFDTVRFTFSEPLDPDFGFLKSDVVSITDPFGNLITVIDVTAVGGTTDTFDVTFASQSATGTYTIHTGFDIRDLANNRMDQNNNGINGETGLAPGGDEFEATDTLASSADIHGANITTAAFAGSTANAFDHVRITFSEALDAEFGFLPSDVVSLTDPSGNAINVNDVKSVGGSATTFDVIFDSQTALGTYTIRTGNTIIDASFNQMDQNQNGTNGEPGVAPAGDEFIATGTLGTSTSTAVFAVGGSDGSVRIFDSVTGALRTEMFPLDSDNGEYQGLVQVALGDFNGDGVADLAVAAANPLGQAGLDASKAGRVFVFDGTTLTSANATLIHTFTPFVNTSGPNGTTGAYVNGLNIAVGDVDGDGKADLIAGSRGGSATAGKFEYGRLIVVGAGAAADGSEDFAIGSDNQGVTPFGPAYQKGVVVAAGNLDGAGGVEIAVTRGGPVASLNPSIQSIKLKAFQFMGSTMTELNLSGTGSPLAPFAGLSGGNIVRDGRVTFTDSTGTGQAQLIFSALDPFSSPGNTQVRIAAFTVDPTTGLATAVSTGTGPSNSYLVGANITDHAIASVAGTGVRNLALITQSDTPQIQYLDPLTGGTLNGGFNLSILAGGVTIDGL